VRKEVLTHFFFLISFFIFISLLRRYFALSYMIFWIGGVVGTILPDIDHLLYVYFLKPYELTSQRTQYLVGRHEFFRTLTLLATTRGERKRLVFHTAFFQGIFLVLAFLVLTSSGSLFGRGLVLAFLLHLLVDQLIDFFELEHLDNWFYQFNLTVGKERALFYWLFNLFVFLLFGFLM
jgi:hypothetical protein